MKNCFRNKTVLFVVVCILPDLESQWVMIDPVKSLKIVNQYCLFYKNEMIKYFYMGFLEQNMF